MRFLLCLILIGLCVCIFVQNKKYKKIENLYVEAKELEIKNDNPYNINRQKQALTLYKQCLKLADRPEYIAFLISVKYTIILFDKKEISKQENAVFREGKNYYVKALNKCQKKIDDYRKFHNFVDVARKQVKQKLFKEALANFLKADAICFVDKLEAEIIKCQENISQQNNYEKALKKSARIAKQGRFQEAIAIVEPELVKFNRDDGRQLLAKLQRICSAKECYRLGLLAERNGIAEGAIKQYNEALRTLPELIECQTRLAILNIKTNNSERAIHCLQGINNTQADYLRGFAYSQLGNWQQANRKWLSINRVSVDIQRSLLKQIIDRDRLSSIIEIEKLVDEGQLEIAKTLSLEFIQKFGSEPTIEHNLENYIQPILESQVWYTGNWQKITSDTEQIWLEQQDIKSLHNWAIAIYYQAQANPNKLADLIIAWSTALVNLDSDPTLQDIPWLGSNLIDIEDVSAKLKQKLEAAIDAVKDSNINEYLKLRDIYRREMVALSLIKQNNCGMRIKQRLFILPGCYQRFSNYLPQIGLPAKIWGALYTDWGLAFAACYEGDTARAIKIKPSRNPASEAEWFACCFISYHEGCYYLQNLQWRKAVRPLQQAKLEIKAKYDWCKEIDRLCELQRQKINDFNEHLQFSKFWYELMDSLAGKSYFAEQSAIQIGIKIDDKKISLSQGLDELRAIRNNIDRHNATTLNLIEKVEYSLNAEKIDRLLKQNQYQEAIRIAKQSQNEAIRFRLAEIFIDVLLSGAENRSLDFEGMYQLAKWAYELCPREPAFMPIYREMKIY